MRYVYRSNTQGTMHNGHEVEVVGGDNFSSTVYCSKCGLLFCAMNSDLIPDISKPNRCAACGGRHYLRAEVVGGHFVRFICLECEGVERAMRSRGIPSQDRRAEAATLVDSARAKLVDAMTGISCSPFQDVVPQIIAARALLASALDRLR